MDCHLTGRLEYHFDNRLALCLVYHWDVMRVCHLVKLNSLEGGKTCPMERWKVVGFEWS
jgi:hypothetical protein